MKKEKKANNQELPDNSEPKIYRFSDSEWLNTEPDSSEIEPSPHGGLHIPIHKLRPLLDRLNASFDGYNVTVFKDSHGVLYAFGSLELTVMVDGVKRTVTGAYNLCIEGVGSGFWNGTLKSECVKNAAAELGKRLGRGLNIESSDKKAQVEVIKMKPDDSIIKKYEEALKNNDTNTVSTLEFIYELK